MAARAAQGGESAPAFGRRVVLPMTLVTLSAVLLAAFGLFWAATRSDSVSVERQIRGMRNALKIGIDEVVQSQKMVTIWDEAVLELARPAPDWDWVDVNMALPLRISFGHSQFYILDDGDNPIYAMHEGVRVSPALYESIRIALRPLVASVRGLAPAPAPSSQDDIGLSQPPPSQGGAGPPYAAGLMDLFRRPAAVSVMRNAPRTENLGKLTGERKLIVCVRFLDSLFLQQLATRYLIEAPRFSRTANPQEGEETLLVEATDGHVMGYMFWRPELPGTKIMRALTPITVMTTGAMIVIMTLLAVSLFRSMRHERKALEEVKAKEAEAQRQALHDALTGLPNRAMLDMRLDQILERGEHAALLLLDLDRFKHVNDTYGHPAGDMLIREFSQRLMGIVRAKDMVARLGGDEFAVLCGEAVNPLDVDMLCQRIVATVGLPFSLAGTDVFVGVSVGICAIPSNGSDRIDVMRKADIALYRAKAEGRNCFRVFTPEMDETTRMRGVIEGELRAALTSGDGLVLHYQPQVRCADRAVVGLEALLRWQHPVHGLIPPGRFISVAEETGLIRELGNWVLRQVCAVSLRWPDLFVAMNLSPVQLRTPGFAQAMIAIVRDSGADPRRIELEITENVLFDDVDVARKVLRELRAAGFRVALDDFGTGYSSMSYLRRFQVDKIKIDRSFIQPVGSDATAASIVTAVLTLGHAMGLAVTAEGVETEEQERFLKGAGCDLMQGYLFSPAVPEDQLSASVDRLGTSPAPQWKSRHRHAV